MLSWLNTIKSLQPGSRAPSCREAPWWINTNHPNMCREQPAPHSHHSTLMVVSIAEHPGLIVIPSVDRRAGHMSKCWWSCESKRSNRDRCLLSVPTVLLPGFHGTTPQKHRRENRLELFADIVKRAGRSTVCWLPQVKIGQSGLMVRSDQTGSGFAQSDARSRYLEGGRVDFSDSSRKHLAIEAVHNLQWVIHICQYRVRVCKHLKFPFDLLAMLNAS